MLVLALSLIQPLLPKSEFFSPPAKIWPAQSFHGFGDTNRKSGSGGVLRIPTPIGESSFEADTVAGVFASVAVLVFLFGWISTAKDLQGLFRIKSNVFLIRKIGKTSIFMSDTILVPFSYWVPGQANVIIPSSLVGRDNEYKIAIAHELQHYRQGDTKWVYILRGLKLLCFVNPLIHFWNQWITELQEFACDETLVDQNKVDSQAYIRCLVEVAQSALDLRQKSVCATGLPLRVESNLLNRRIEKMLSKSSTAPGRSIGIAVGSLIAITLAATAFASNGLIQDRRVSMDQAKAMAARAISESEFPLVVNDLVLEQLNRYIGTPEGREHMKGALSRMQNYKDPIGGYIREYRVPIEIMAVPIVESGYQNLKQGESSPTVKSAGLWQLIPSTARNFGLRVDDKVDERLSVSLLTDAAMRYLSSNNLRFKDWQLAALSYNMGESAVQNAMNELNTRDAWTLIRNGFEGDKAYLAKLMAAILIMKNPESVE